MGKLKEFLKSLKFGEWLYISLVIVTIILSVYISMIELADISQLNKDIATQESEIERLQEIIDENDYLGSLSSIYYAVGRSLDSQIEGTKLDRMSATSIDLNMRLQNIIDAECQNTNKLFTYFKEQLNCTKVSPEYAFFDKSEMVKLNERMRKMFEIKGDLKNALSTSQKERQGKVDFRNFLYVFLVFLSGLGIAFQYVVRKYYERKESSTINPPG